MSIKIKDLVNSLTKLDEYSFSYDTFGDVNIVTKKGKRSEVTDNIVTILTVLLEDDYPTSPPIGLMEQAIDLVCKKNSFHPVRNFLDRLEWDGESRIKKWLSIVGGLPPNHYSEEFSDKFLIGCVARVMNPGCKLDNILIIEGEQGIGKSSMLKILASQWFSDAPFYIASKDSYIAMRGYWVIELPELMVLKRANSQMTKSFFSQRVDSYRPPYKRRNISFKRQCVFVGTTNEDKYLIDTTGNRRYWCVKINFVDGGWLLNNVKQLWAEARYQYDEGVKWYFEDTPYAVEEATNQRMLASLDFNQIANMTIGRKTTVTTAIIARQMGMENPTPNQMKDITSAMTKIGWQPSHVYDEDGSRVRGFAKPSETGVLI